MRLVRPQAIANAEKTCRENIEDKLKKGLRFEVQVLILESQVSKHSDNFFEINYMYLILKYITT